MSGCPKLLLSSIALSATLLAALPVHADWDAKAEAERQAQREAEQREERARQAKAEAAKAAAIAQANAAIMADKRKTLGAAANGKSDADVNRLYDAHIAAKTAEANAAIAEGQKALSSGAGAAALKSVTGHSMQELQSMSDEDLEALAAEMEKKFGGD